MRKLSPSKTWVPPRILFPGIVLFPNQMEEFQELGLDNTRVWLGHAWHRFFNGFVWFNGALCQYAWTFFVKKYGGVYVLNSILNVCIHSWLCGIYVYSCLLHNVCAVLDFIHNWRGVPMLGAGNLTCSDQIIYYYLTLDIRHKGIINNQHTVFQCYLWQVIQGGQHNAEAISTDTLMLLWMQCQPNLNLHQSQSSTPSQVPARTSKTTWWDIKSTIFWPQLKHNYRDTCPMLWRALSRLRAMNGVSAFAPSPNLPLQFTTWGNIMPYILSWQKTLTSFVPMVFSP